MSEKQAKLELLEKIDKIAKEIAKGNDVYITKSASEIKLKSMNVSTIK